jgi:hypothetical protein
MASLEQEQAMMANVTILSAARRLLELPDHVKYYGQLKEWEEEHGHKVPEFVGEAFLILCNGHCKEHEATMKTSQFLKLNMMEDLNLDIVNLANEMTFGLAMNGRSRFSLGTRMLVVAVAATAWVGMPDCILSLHQPSIQMRVNSDHDCDSTEGHGKPRLPNGQSAGAVQLPPPIRTR